MGKVVNMFWVISLIAFLGAFVAVYSFLPQEVAINSDAGGRANQFVTKEVFFYGGIGFFLMTNIVLYLFSHLINMEATRLQARGAGQSGLYTFRNKLAVWVKGLTILINLFFISLTLFIGVFNTSEVGTFDYVLLIYLVPVLITGWLIYLGVIISGAVRRA